ncbi:MAG: uracil-DNA glycosylase [Proteobacteria bacterium]|nr:uracil-DNA glycosylase [Pseudomonadota bacterium]
MTATSHASREQRAIRLEDSWKQVLAAEFDAEYMQTLRQFLREEKARGKQIFPPGEEIFSALNTTPVDSTKVVILGQDPYHGVGQAHGLCFSVKKGIALPPSLLNIYKELQSDIGFVPPEHGSLTHWAEQGVLLLNAVLTVEAGRAASHQGVGWERFTDQIVKILNEQKSGLVFILWGSYAQKKGAMIDRRKHLVLQSPHPSPLSASRGFFGNRHFSQANAYLARQGKTAIDWQLSPDPD